MKRANWWHGLLAVAVVACGLAYGSVAKGNSYAIIPWTQGWIAAKADAEARGGHLATITSEEEWNIISSFFGNEVDGCLLGGTDAGHEGVWTWVTGEAWEYTRWETGEPNNGHDEQHYLWIWAGHDGNWDDVKETSGAKYLFEFENTNTNTVVQRATVDNVTAKQRFPWNGLVDITCTVTGLEPGAQGQLFTVAVVAPDAGITNTVSHFWLVQNGKKSTYCEVRTNGDYHLVWDAWADLGAVNYSNLIARVRTTGPGKVQLWAGGPYWADTNLGAEEPWETGYYFWWGDTVGYKREGGDWEARDGSSTNFTFGGTNAPTYGKSISDLPSEGWLVEGKNRLAQEHDAARVLWGGGWRMPTIYELRDIFRKCNWTWTTTNGVNGYVVTGRGEYAANSIFLPAAGIGGGISLYDFGLNGYLWSSTAYTKASGYLFFASDDIYMDVEDYDFRDGGCSIRPVQDFIE